MEKATGDTGLPPIEVYQIGDAYFVLDGNHRVSVARELGASHIQAYVTEVISRVPLSPDITPDELITKAEQVKFLEKTQLDKLHPGVDINVTNPGQYPILEEHISVHRYFMGIEAGREIPYTEAVTHWYEEIYTPVINIIRERGILSRFPKRSETDLYLWISKHRGELEDSLGWSLGIEAVADDLVYSYAQDFLETITGFVNRILDVVIPDPLESGPPVGHWRRKYIETKERDCLFPNILVTVERDMNKWLALEQGIILATKEDAILRGLHVVEKHDSLEQTTAENIQKMFSETCLTNGIQGELAIEKGKIPRVICERSHWADLIISNLSHPPGKKASDRLDSGFHTIIRRCPRPILAVPTKPTHLHHALLAFNDSPKSLEALFIGAYMAGKWGTHLSVLTIDQKELDIEATHKTAQNYLEANGITADYILIRNDGLLSEIFMKTANEIGCDIVLMGGYKASPVVEIVLGSVVDQVLRITNLPILICR
jgi:nucleotide-binding universal stress UspA family protein